MLYVVVVVLAVIGTCLARTGLMRLFFFGLAVCVGIASIAAVDAAMTVLLR